MSGKVGVLHTGHWLVDCRDTDDDGGSGATLGGVSSASVYFAKLTDEEIDAYVATGEPLQVAGSFTIDSLGGAFIEKVDGEAAIWETDSAYWSLYVGEEYATTGISTTPVYDGSVFKLIYETFSE
jgi:hypothetical protein